MLELTLKTKVLNHMFNLKMSRVTRREKEHGKHVWK